MQFPSSKGFQPKKKKKLSERKYPKILKNIFQNINISCNNSSMFSLSYNHLAGGKTTKAIDLIPKQRIEASPRPKNQALSKSYILVPIK